MTTQSRLQDQIDFEREMADYYEEIGLDRLAERSRSIAADKASVAAELADPAALYAERQIDFELEGIGPRDRPEPEPEPEAEI
jgi:hypothetical protein